MFTVRAVIYEAFVEGKLEAPKQLVRAVHDLYFEPKYDESLPRKILESVACFHEVSPGKSRHSCAEQSAWHVSIQTTERYLARKQRMQGAVNDKNRYRATGLSGRLCVRFADNPLNGSF